MFNPMIDAILVPAIKATNGEGMFFKKSTFCSSRDQENSINKEGRATNSASVFAFFKFFEKF